MKTCTPTSLNTDVPRVDSTTDTSGTFTERTLYLRGERIHELEASAEAQQEEIEELQRQVETLASDREELHDDMNRAFQVLRGFVSPDFDDGEDSPLMEAAKVCRQDLNTAISERDNAHDSGVENEEANELWRVIDNGGTAESLTHLLNERRQGLLALKGGTAREAADVLYNMLYASRPENVGIDAAWYVAGMMSGAINRWQGDAPWLTALKEGLARAEKAGLRQQGCCDWYEHDVVGVRTRLCEEYRSISQLNRVPRPQPLEFCGRLGSANLVDPSGCSVYGFNLDADLKLRQWPAICTEVSVYEGSDDIKSTSLTQAWGEIKLSRIWRDPFTKVLWAEGVQLNTMPEYLYSGPQSFSIGTSNPHDPALLEMEGAYGVESGRGIQWVSDLVLPQQTSLRELLESTFKNTARVQFGIANVMVQECDSGEAGSVYFRLYLRVPTKSAA